MEIGVGRHRKPAIFHQAVERAVKVPKTICRFGVGILAHAEFLIPFGGHVNVEVVERVGFDLVGVLMAFPVVAAQPEKLVAACGANRQDKREVQDVQTVLPRN